MVKGEGNKFCKFCFPTHLKHAPSFDITSTPAFQTVMHICPSMQIKLVYYEASRSINMLVAFWQQPKYWCVGMLKTHVMCFDIIHYTRYHLQIALKTLFDFLMIAKSKVIERLWRNSIDKKNYQLCPLLFYTLLFKLFNTISIVLIGWLFANTLRFAISSRIWLAKQSRFNNSIERDISG